MKNNWIKSKINTNRLFHNKMYTMRNNKFSHKKLEINRIHKKTNFKEKKNNDKLKKINFKQNNPILMSLMT